MDEVGGRAQMSRSVSKVNFQTKHTKLTISKVAEQRWSVWVNHKRSLANARAKSWAQHWLLETACSERMLSVHMCLFRSVGLLSLSRFLMWSRKCLAAPLKPCLRWSSKLFVRVPTTTTTTSPITWKLNLKVKSLRTHDFTGWKDVHKRLDGFDVKTHLKSFQSAASQQCKSQCKKNEKDTVLWQLGRRVQHERQDIISCAVEKKINSPSAVAQVFFFFGFFYFIFSPVKLQFVLRVKEWGACVNLENITWG